MRLVLLTSDSPAQRALAQRFDALRDVEVSAIVVQRIAGTRGLRAATRLARRRPAALASKVAQRVRYAGELAAIERGEVEAFGSQGRELPWPDVPVDVVDDINGETATAAIRSARPDLIAVSGTKLVKQPVFSLAPPRGLVNLHTGISPFIKGGPNCTLWCLASASPHLIGVTVHELDPGIDTGRLLLTRQPALRRDMTVADLVWATVRTGHDAYAEVVAALADGRSPQGVQQSLVGVGRTYYTREWNVLQLRRALRYVSSGRFCAWVDAGCPGRDEVALVDVLASS